MRKNINVSLYKNNRREINYNNINAISKEDSYSFIMDKIKMFISDDLLTRENEEFEFRLDMKNKTASYLLKEKNMLFDIEVEKINIQKDNNTIIIEYKISSDEEEFKIKIEENKNE